jgi:hypothetical protein
MTCSEGSKSETWTLRLPRNALRTARREQAALVYGSSHACRSQYFWCGRLCASPDTELVLLSPMRGVFSDIGFDFPSIHTAPKC